MNSKSEVLRIVRILENQWDELVSVLLSVLPDTEDEIEDRSIAQQKGVEVILQALEYKVITRDESNELIERIDRFWAQRDQVKEKERQKPKPESALVKLDHMVIASKARWDKVEAEQKRIRKTLTLAKRAR